MIPPEKQTVKAENKAVTVDGRTLGSKLRDIAKDPDVQTATSAAIALAFSHPMSKKLEEIIPKAMTAGKGKRDEAVVTETSAAKILGADNLPDDDEVEEQGVKVSREGKTAEAAPSKRIFVSIPDKKLILMDGDKVAGEYPAMLGDAAAPTPHGEFRIIEQIPWHGSVMGPAWMGFDDKTSPTFYYGIHGTGPEHDPNATHGCVALTNEDVMKLYGQVSKGTPVVIFDRPYEYPFNPKPPAFKVPEVK